MLDLHKLPELEPEGLGEKERNRIGKKKIFIASRIRAESEFYFPFSCSFAKLLATPFSNIFKIICVYIIVDIYAHTNVYVGMCGERAS